MKIGYARVSAKDQDLSLQIDALEEAACTRIYQEQITGTTKERPELQKMLEQLREGDLIIIWKLDRLARSLKDLVGLVTEINEKGAGLTSLHDHIDTTTPHGKFTFHLFAALAEFERDIIRERTNAGLATTQARGRKNDRPKWLSKKAQNTAIIPSLTGLPALRGEQYLSSLTTNGRQVPGTTGGSTTIYGWYPRWRIGGRQ